MNKEKVLFVVACIFISLLLIALAIVAGDFVTKATTP